MPELIKLYIRQCFIGFGIAILFVAMLYAFNIGNLWTLVSNSDDGILVTAMLVMSNAVVFCGVQFAIAIMRLADTEEDDAPRGGTPVRQPRMQPSRVPVISRRPPHPQDRAERRAYW